MLDTVKAEASAPPPPPPLPLSPPGLPARPAPRSTPPLPLDLRRQARCAFLATWRERVIAPLAFAEPARDRGGVRVVLSSSSERTNQVSSEIGGATELLENFGTTDQVGAREAGSLGKITRSQSARRSRFARRRRRRSTNRAADRRATSRRRPSRV